MTDLRKMNKAQKLEFFAETCQEPSNFSCEKGVLIFSDEVVDIICSIVNLKSKKKRAKVKAARKFLLDSLRRGCANVATRK